MKKMSVTRELRRPHNFISRPREEFASKAKIKTNGESVGAKKHIKCCQNINWYNHFGKCYGIYLSIQRQLQQDQQSHVRISIKEYKSINIKIKPINSMFLLCYLQQLNYRSNVDIWLDTEDAIHLYNRIFLSNIKDEILPFIAKWKELKGIM